MADEQQATPQTPPAPTPTQATATEAPPERPAGEAPRRPGDDLIGDERQVRGEPPGAARRQVLKAAQVRPRPPSLAVGGRVVHAHQDHGSLEVRIEQRGRGEQQLACQ